MPTVQIVPTVVDPDELLVEDGVVLIGSITVIHALRSASGESIKTASGQYFGTAGAVGA